MTSSIEEVASFAGAADVVDAALALWSADRAQTCREVVARSALEAGSAVVASDAASDVANARRAPRSSQEETVGALLAARLRADEAVAEGGVADGTAESAEVLSHFAGQTPV